MKISFKIPHGFASHLVCQRELRNVYQTNRAVRLYGFFALLKTITTSGKIKDYHLQLDLICNLTKRSRSSVFAYISKCECAGLLTKAGTDLYLKSWQDVVEANENAVYSPLYTELQYDVNNARQTPEYMVYAAEIAENQARQTKAVIRQIENNRPLAEKLAPVHPGNPEKLVEQLQALQAQAFACGRSENDYPLIQSINADVQRTAKTLRRTYCFKSRRSVKYLKVQLMLRGIAAIEKRCLESEERNRVNKNLYYTGYNQETTNTFWRRPDRIRLKVAHPQQN